MKKAKEDAAEKQTTKIKIMEDGNFLATATQPDGQQLNKAKILVWGPHQL